MAKKKVNQQREEKQENPDSTSRSALVPATSKLKLEGNTASELAFIIEGPTFDGKAGQLLQKMIQAMGVRHTSILMISVPADVLVTDILLDLKTTLEKAKIVVTLGEALTQKLLAHSESLAEMRSKLHPYFHAKLIASFHPSELLATAALKKEAWEDLKLAVKELGWTLPNRGV